MSMKSSRRRRLLGLLFLSAAALLLLPAAPAAADSRTTTETTTTTTTVTRPGPQVTYTVTTTEQVPVVTRTRVKTGTECSFDPFAGEQCYDTYTTVRTTTYKTVTTTTTECCKPGPPITTTETYTTTTTVDVPHTHPDPPPVYPPPIYIPPPKNNQCPAGTTGTYPNCVKTQTTSDADDDDDDSTPVYPPPIYIPQPKPPDSSTSNPGSTCSATDKADPSDTSCYEQPSGTNTNIDQQQKKTNKQVADEVKTKCGLPRSGHIMVMTDPSDSSTCQEIKDTSAHSENKPTLDADGKPTGGEKNSKCINPADPAGPPVAAGTNGACPTVWCPGHTMRVVGTDANGKRIMEGTSRLAVNGCSGTANYIKTGCTDAMRKDPSDSCYIPPTGPTTTTTTACTPGTWQETGRKTLTDGSEEITESDGCTTRVTTKPPTTTTCTPGTWTPITTQRHADGSATITETDGCTERQTTSPPPPCSAADRKNILNSRCYVPPPDPNRPQCTAADLTDPTQQKDEFVIDTNVGAWDHDNDPNTADVQAFLTVDWNGNGVWDAGTGCFRKSVRPPDPPQRKPAAPTPPAAPIRPVRPDAPALPIGECGFSQAVGKLAATVWFDVPDDDAENRYEIKLRFVSDSGRKTILSEDVLRQINDARTALTVAQTTAGSAAYQTAKTEYEAAKAAYDAADRESDEAYVAYATLRQIAYDAAEAAGLAADYARTAAQWSARTDALAGIADRDVNVGSLTVADQHGSDDIEIGKKHRDLAIAARDSAKQAAANAEAEHDRVAASSDVPPDPDDYKTGKRTKFIGPSKIWLGTKDNNGADVSGNVEGRTDISTYGILKHSGAGDVGGLASDAEFSAMFVEAERAKKTHNDKWGTDHDNDPSTPVLGGGSSAPDIWYQLGDSIYWETVQKELETAGYSFKVVNSQENVLDSVQYQSAVTRYLAQLRTDKASADRAFAEAEKAARQAEYARLHAAKVQALLEAARQRDADATSDIISKRSDYQAKKVVWEEWKAKADTTRAQSDLDVLLAVQNKHTAAVFSSGRSPIAITTVASGESISVALTVRKQERVSKTENEQTVWSDWSPWSQWSEWTMLVPLGSAGDSGLVLIGEPWSDKNGNGKWDAERAAGNGVYDRGEDFVDAGNGVWDQPETLLTATWVAGTHYTDSNSNGVYDNGERFDLTSLTAGTHYTDSNGNGRWDSGEPVRETNPGGWFAVDHDSDATTPDWYYLDRGNGVWDSGESFTDSTALTAEPYIDENGNEVSPGIGERFIDKNGNGQYDPAPPCPIPPPDTRTINLLPCKDSQGNALTDSKGNKLFADPWNTGCYPANDRCMELRETLIPANMVAGTHYDDADGDGAFDAGDTLFVGSLVAGTHYTDSNSNGQWDAGPCQPRGS